MILTAGSLQQRPGGDRLGFSWTLRANKGEDYGPGEKRSPLPERGGFGFIGERRATPVMELDGGQRHARN